MKKFATDVKRATYLELWKLLDSLGLDKIIKSAPTVGSKISEDKIGKSIII